MKGAVAGQTVVGAPATGTLGGAPHALALSGHDATQNASTGDVVVAALEVVVLTDPATLAFGVAAQRISQSASKAVKRATRRLDVPAFTGDRPCDGEPAGTQPSGEACHAIADVHIDVEGMVGTASTDVRCVVRGTGSERSAALFIEATQRSLFGERALPGVETEPHASLPSSSEHGIPLRGDTSALKGRHWPSLPPQLKLRPTNADTNRMISPATLTVLYAVAYLLTTAVLLTVAVAAL